MDRKNEKELEQKQQQELIMNKRVIEKEDGRYLIYYNFETIGDPVEDSPFEPEDRPKEKGVIQKEQEDKSAIERDEGIV